MLGKYPLRLVWIEWLLCDLVMVITIHFFRWILFEAVFISHTYCLLAWSASDTSITYRQHGFVFYFSRVLGRRNFCCSEKTQKNILVHIFIVRQRIVQYRRTIWSLSKCESGIYYLLTIFPWQIVTYLINNIAAVETSHETKLLPPPLSNVFDFGMRLIFYSMFHRFGHAKFA
jgi:hypothetical protein